MPAESVHCTITSPPYYNLRDYGVPGQIGLEATPTEYVDALVEVLRSDGSLWLVLGDSYASGSGGDRRMGDPSNPRAGHAAEWRSRARPQVSGYKPKDLLGMPWRVAFALQADGWYLRRDIIWAKKNVMPESVRDRPTSAHEYMFLLTKEPRYFYDAEAIKEPCSDNSHGSPRINPGPKNIVLGHTGGTLGKWTSSDKTAGRNKRSVWTVASAPYKGSHFATFPPKLIEPRILAGTSDRGVCPKCGAPWVRVVAKAETVPQRSGEWKSTGEQHRNDIDRKGGFYPAQQTSGWQPTCEHCALNPVPATILDPFFGAGTTGLVAEQHGRDCIGIELNASYAEMARERTKPPRQRKMRLAAA